MGVQLPVGPRWDRHKCPVRQISCVGRASPGPAGPPPDMFIRADLEQGKGVEESQAWLADSASGGLLPEAGAEGRVSVALLRPPYGTLRPVVVAGRRRTAFITLSTDGPPGPPRGGPTPFAVPIANRLCMALLRDCAGRCMA